MSPRANAGTRVVGPSRLVSRKGSARSLDERECDERQGDRRRGLRKRERQVKDRRGSTAHGHGGKCRASAVRPLASKTPETAEYWVVVRTRDYIEFYDPEKKEFGLADVEINGGLPITIGVRGDLVGTFCAM